MKIKHGSPEISENDIEAVLQVLQSGEVSSGSEVGRLEVEMANYHGKKFGLAFNSWTSAGFLLLEHLRKNSDRRKVLVPSFTFSASVNVIKNAGLEPVFVDIDPDTFSLDAETVEEMLNDEVLAVMIVHYAGLVSPATSEIHRICSENGVVLIEDCAESLGATDRDGNLAGTYGEAIFSLFATKNITSGEGGVWATNHEGWSEKLALQRGHGVRRSGPFPWNRDAELPGHNFRMSNLNAALGLSQFRNLHHLTGKRTKIADLYFSLLENEPAIALPKVELFGTPSWQMFPILIDPRLSRNDIAMGLRKSEIEASVHFDPPVHRQKAYENAQVRLPQTDDVASRVITLPMSPTLSVGDVELVCAELVRLI